MHNAKNVRVSEETHSLLFAAMNRMSDEMRMRITMGKVVELITRALILDEDEQLDITGLKRLLKGSVIT